MSVNHYSPLPKDIKSLAMYFRSQLSVKILTISIQCFWLFIFCLVCLLGVRSFMLNHRLQIYISQMCNWVYQYYKSNHTS